MQPKVYIVLVNFNNHENTTETIESILKLDYSNYQILVSDNLSTDQTISNLTRWAEGKITYDYNPPDEIRNHLFPLSAKPLSYRVIHDREVVEHSYPPQDEAAGARPIIFIRSYSDRGFAGGNNLCTQFALQQGDASFIWLLNNDTLQDSAALTELVQKAADYAIQRRKVGIIGSKLYYYHMPQTIQAVGGMFNPKNTWSYHLGVREADAGQYDIDELKFDYVYGASLFCRREFIEEVGLMNETYYAYYEEIDWKLRGEKSGWEMGYAWKSRIWHKQGVTTGKKIKSKKRPQFFMCLKYVNLLVFYRMYYPQYIFAAYTRLFLKALKNIPEGNFSETWLIIRIIFGKRTCTRP